MKIIKSIFILLLSIILYILSFILFFDMVIKLNDYIMLIPSGALVLLATIFLFIFIEIVFLGKKEYQLIDNLLIIKRKNKVVKEINILELASITKYMDSFKENIHYIKFKYQNKKYTIDINDKNKHLLSILEGKQIIEKTDYLVYLHTIIQFFGG